MSQSTIASRARLAAACIGMLAAGSAPVGAQVQITFFETHPAAAPDPNAPFDGGDIFCTTVAAGTPLGFFFNFDDPGTRSALCPENPGRLDPNVNTFGARITGSLIAPSDGLFQLFVSSDDGAVLTINGATVFSNWVPQAGGPGLIGNLPLNAGANPFVLDYFQNPVVDAFIQFEARGGVTVAPTPVPEPATILLTASGLAVLLAVGRRRRTHG